MNPILLVEPAEQKRFLQTTSDQEIDQFLKLLDQHQRQAVDLILAKRTPPTGVKALTQAAAAGGSHLETRISRKQPTENTSLESSIPAKPEAE